MSSLPFPEHIDFRSYTVLRNVHYLQFTKKANENFLPKLQPILKVSLEIYANTVPDIQEIRRQFQFHSHFA